VVWLEGALRTGHYPLTGSTHDVVPADVADDLRTSRDEPGFFCAVDVTALTRQTPFDEAVLAGTAMITGQDE
jgi:hypothetical protein